MAINSKPVVRERATAWDVEYNRGRNPEWQPGAKCSRYLREHFSLSKADFKTREKAEKEAQRRVDAARAAATPGAPVAKAQDRRMTLAQFAPTVLTAARANPKEKFGYVPVGPGTAARDLKTWRHNCAHRVGAWTFNDLKEVPDALAKLHSLRDSLYRPYTAEERRQDAARGVKKLRPVGFVYKPNMAAKVLQCIKNVLREAARVGLVDPALVRDFQFRGTRSTNAGKVDLPLVVFETAWTYFGGQYEGLLPPSYNLVRLGMLWSLGGRPGELAALEWSDFSGLDDDAAPLQVLVTRAVEEAAPQAKITIGKTKTEKHQDRGREPVWLPDLLRAPLRDWRAYQQDRRAAAGITGRWHVVTNQHGTTDAAEVKQLLTGWWRRHKPAITALLRDAGELEAAELLIKAQGQYAFRHSFSLRSLRATGWDVELVSGLMGNSPKTIMDAYLPQLKQARRGTAVPAYVTAATPDSLNKTGQDGPTPDPVPGNVVPFRHVA